MKSAESAITELVYTYAERIDLGDFDGVGALFADAEITAEGGDVSWRGKDDVAAMYASFTRRYPNGTPNSKHVTTNLIVDADEDAGTATARSYFTVMQAVPGSLPLQPVISGRYRDSFERVDRVWRFSRRHMIVDLVGDLSQHLLYDYEAPSS
jgi:hypothetical protein